MGCGQFKFQSVLFYTQLNGQIMQSIISSTVCIKKLPSLCVAHVALRMLLAYSLNQSIAFSGQ